MNTPDLRPSPIAGTWYEADPKRLARDIDGYLANVRLPEFNGEVIGVIVPHAGHRYSGQVAAHAFAALRGLVPDLVAIVSPFHNFAPDPLLTTKHQAYHTPLGDIEVDQLASKELQSKLDIHITPVVRDREHSLEIELPFLQRVLGSKFKLLPIMLRAQDADVAEKLGNAMASVLKNRTSVLVASTDLSHFQPEKIANTLDREMLRRFESFDPSGIFAAERSGSGSACGHGAVAAVLWASKALGANAVQVVNYATSGDVTGDQSSVVGYGAAVILKPI